MLEVPQIQEELSEEEARRYDVVAVNVVVVVTTEGALCDVLVYFGQ